MRNGGNNTRIPDFGASDWTIENGLMEAWCLVGSLGNILPGDSMKARCMENYVQLNQLIETWVTSRPFLSDQVPWKPAPFP